MVVLEPGWQCVIVPTLIIGCTGSRLTVCYCTNLDHWLYWNQAGSVLLYQTWSLVGLETGWQCVIVPTLIIGCTGTRLAVCYYNNLDHWLYCQAGSLLLYQPWSLVVLEPGWQSVIVPALIFGCTGTRLAVCYCTNLDHWLYWNQAGSVLLYQPWSLVGLETGWQSCYCTNVDHWLFWNQAGRVLLYQPWSFDVLEPGWQSVIVPTFDHWLYWNQAGSLLLYQPWSLVVLEPGWQCVIITTLIIRCTGNRLAGCYCTNFDHWLYWKQVGRVLLYQSWSLVILEPGWQSVIVPILIIGYTGTRLAV